MENPIVSVVKTGTTLQGSGASAGALVLLSKEAMDPEFTIILCHAPASPHHPYVVWTYNERTGQCYTGDYYDNQVEAADRFAERTW